MFHIFIIIVYYSIYYYYCIITVNGDDNNGGDDGYTGLIIRVFTYLAKRVMILNYYVTL